MRGKRHDQQSVPAYCIRLLPQKLQKIFMPRVGGDRSGSLQQFITMLRFRLVRLALEREHDAFRHHERRSRSIDRRYARSTASSTAYFTGVSVVSMKSRIPTNRAADSPSCAGARGSGAPSRGRTPAFATLPTSSMTATNAPARCLTNMIVLDGARIEKDSDSPLLLRNGDRCPCRAPRITDRN